MSWASAALRGTALVGLLLLAAAATTVGPASSHAPSVAGESPGNPAGLAGIPFRGPNGTNIEDAPCPPIPDSMAEFFDDDNTYSDPPGWGHIGHINGVTGPGTVISNYITEGSVDLFHFENEAYNDPTAIEGPHEVTLVDASVMMGPDGFFRGQMLQTIHDAAGPDLRITDVHFRRTYCVYGALEHDGPYLFIDSTFNDPAFSQVTELDLSTFYTPLWNDTYHDDPDSRMNYVMLISSAFEDEENPTFIPPVATFTYDPAAACGSDEMVFSSAAGDTDGFIVSYAWDFGDATTGSGIVTHHTYASPALYNVTLTVTDDDGLSTTVSQLVASLDGPNCCPSLDVPELIYIPEGALLEFAAYGVDEDGDPLTFTLHPFHLDATVTTDGWFSWQTAAGDAGWYTATIHVTDGFCTVDKPTRIAVQTQATYDAVYDSDWDSIEDEADNCPSIRNRGQEDTDRDGVGDACDEGAAAPGTTTQGPVSAASKADADADGIPDASDLCPLHADASQGDMDGDRTGDACDLDADGDNVPESGTAGLFLDNCPTAANADQADGDGDGRGDRCDAPGLAARDAAGPPTPDADGAARPASALPAWILPAAVAGGAGIAAVASLVILRRRQQGP